MVDVGTGSGCLSVAENNYVLTPNRVVQQLCGKRTRFWRTVVKSTSPSKVQNFYPELRTHLDKSLVKGCAEFQVKKTDIEEVSSGDGCIGEPILHRFISSIYECII